MGDDRAKRLDAYAGQVMRYVEYVWPKLERTGGVPDVPMDRKAKGESAPPVGDHALRVMGKNGGKEWDENGAPLTSQVAREVFAMMRAELDVLEGGRNSMKSSSGYGFTEVLRAVREDAGRITAWRAGETTEAESKYTALWEACKYVAWVLLYHDPREEGGEPYDLWVKVSQEDLAARTRRQGAALDREAGRRDQMAKAHHRRYEALLAIEREHPDMSREAAKVEWSKRHDMSVSTIRDSIHFCERHEWPGGKGRHGGWQSEGQPVAPEHRYKQSNGGEAA
jgi:hypothetical protein